MKGLEDVISDAATLGKVHTMFTKCYDNVVQSGATGNEQTVKIANFATSRQTLIKAECSFLRISLHTSVQNAVLIFFLESTFNFMSIVFDIYLLKCIFVLTIR